MTTPSDGRCQCGLCDVCPSPKDCAKARKLAGTDELAAKLFRERHPVADPVGTSELRGER